jgi:hypothetical protein
MDCESGDLSERGRRKQGVSEIAMDVFGRFKDRAVGRNPEIHFKQAELEYSAVPDEGHDIDDGRSSLASH